MRPIIILLILIGIPAFYIFLIIKRNKKEKKQTLASANKIIHYDENIKNLQENNDLMFITDITKSGKITKYSNLIVIIFVLLLLLFGAFLTVSKDASPNITQSDANMKLGVAIFITLFYSIIFYSIFQPVKKMYSRFLNYSKGKIHSTQFRKYLKTCTRNSMILSIFFVPLSFGIFAILMIPQYTLQSKLKKIKLQ